MFEALGFFIVCDLWFFLCLFGLRVLFVKLSIVEDQPITRSRRFQNLPPLITLEPPPPPQRRRLDTNGSFEPIGVSEVPGEPELRENYFDLTTVEIEDLQADKFARNFNSPLTDLNDLVIVKVLPF